LITPQGPGFFIFFRNETIESGGYEPVFVDYGGYVPKFKPKGKEEKKAKPIIEHIAETILATPEIETEKEIDLMLRLKLEYEGLTYKKLYLTWIIEQINVQRRNAIILLLLH